MTTLAPAPSRLLIVAIFTLVLFSPLAIDIYLPALPLIAQSYAIDNTLAQDTITYFMFTLGLGQLFAGPLADRYGRKPIAISGVIIYGVSATLAWFATTIDALLIARLMQGFGACATAVVAFATTRDLFGPVRSGRMISYLNGAICFIPALAPLLGSWLTQEFGWRSNFSFMVGFAVICLLFILTVFKETRPAETFVSKRLFSSERYYSVLKQPIFLYHAMMCMLAMAVILAYVTSAPSYLMGELGLNMSQFTYWFGVNAIFNIIASFAAPKLMDKLGSHRALALGLWSLVSAGILMWALSGMANAAAFMIPIILSSIGFALTLGVSAGKALAPFGDRAGTAAALLGLLQMSGASLLVGLMQRIDLSSSTLMTIQMLFLLPGAMWLYSKRARGWH